MKTKLVLKYTYTADYQLKRKVRFVVCGYSQIKNLDYTETFAPTTTSSVTFVICQFCSSNGYFMAAFDVEAAFLEGKADHKMYALLPKDLDKDQTRVEIVGNWYGLKQGPRIWNDQLNFILLDIGFIRCDAHPCLYSRLREGVFIVLGVHVDDGLMGCSHEAEFEIFLTEFKQYVRQATISRDLLKFTGIMLDYNREERWIRLSHSIYITQRLSEFTGKATVPISAATNLRIAEPMEGADSLLPDTGTFRFIADRARPDILTAVGELSTGGSVNPSQQHQDTSRQIKNYLTSTKDLYVQLGGLGKITIFGYSDASYITEGNAKSRLGGCIFMNLNSGAVFSFSRNDTIRNILGKFMSALSHSSTESEIKALDVLITELLHLLDIIRFIAGEQERPFKIYCDNRSAAMIFDTLKTNHKIKHLNMRIQAIREHILSGLLAIHFVPTNENVADLLTKPLAAEKFLRFRKTLMIGHGGVSPSWMSSESTVHTAMTALVLQEE
jgi:hypothetical protein